MNFSGLHICDITMETGKWAVVYHREKTIALMTRLQDPVSLIEYCGIIQLGPERLLSIPMGDDLLHIDSTTEERLHTCRVEHEKWIGIFDVHRH